MVKRLKIGLIFSYNSDWVAGTYYILNLVYALNTQDDKDKPELIILSYSLDDYNTIKETGYPYLKFHQLFRADFAASYSLVERVINKGGRMLTNRNLIQKEQTKKRLKVDLDLLFPASDHIYFSKIKNRLYWIPDFQEHFLPHFFSEEEILSRKKYKKQLSDKASSIVFSSNDALEHFNTLYPISSAKTFVMQFAVTHPDYHDISIDFLRSKFSINKPYFFCPNQVWIHKNHITVLRSIKLLKDEGENDVLVVFSGKEYDNRNPEVFNGLKKYISENEIEENVKFLGFIDRKEQLQLMNNAIAVLQPSLFEGWSTSIEDVKAMGQYVVASDIAVNKEQVKENVTFFDPADVKQLTDCLKKLQYNPPLKANKNNYRQDIVKFGKQFIKIANAIKAS